MSLRYLSVNPALAELERARRNTVHDLQADQAAQRMAMAERNVTIDNEGRSMEAALDEALRMGLSEAYGGTPAAAGPAANVIPFPGGGVVPPSAGADAAAMSGSGAPAAAGGDPRGGLMDPVMRELSGVKGGGSMMADRSGQIDKGMGLLINATAAGEHDLADAYAQHFGLADKGGNWHPKIAKLRGQPMAANGLKYAKELGYAGPQALQFTKAFVRAGGNVAQAMEAAGPARNPRLITGKAGDQVGHFSVDPNFPGDAQAVSLPGGETVQALPKAGEITTPQARTNDSIDSARAILEQQGWLEDLEALRGKVIKGIETWSLQEQYDPALRALVDLATKRKYGEDPEYETKWAPLTMPAAANAQEELPPAPGAEASAEAGGPGWLERAVKWWDETAGGPALRQGLGINPNPTQAGADVVSGAAPAPGDTSIEGAPIVTMTWEQMQPYIGMSPEQLRSRFTTGQLRTLAERMDQLAAERRGGGQPLPGGP